MDPLVVYNVVSMGGPDGNISMSMMYVADNLRNLSMSEVLGE